MRAGVCRACLREGVGRCIFRGRKRVAGRAVRPVDMLVLCAPYPVTIDDGFPDHICLQCYRKLCSAYKFRVQCESSYNTFLNNRAENLKLEEIKSERHDESQNSNLKKPSEEEVIPQQPTEPDLLEIVEVQLLKAEDSIEDPFFEDEKFSQYDDIPLDEISEREKEEKKKMKKAMKKSSKKKFKHYKQLESPDSENKPFTCTFCSKQFKWKHLLLSHQDSHYGIKRYFCEICQKAYRTERDHKNMHRRGFKFKCEICSKCFNTKAKLAIHKETHSTEREKFLCDVEGCGKAFLSVNGLDRHKLSHTGAKDFICQMCSKSFIDKYQLEVHVKIHTNDRKHPCGFCDKKFITTSARNAHERWHTKTKNYVCQYCEKGFVSSSGLKRHILCHTKEQLQACRFCGKKFARFDNRKRHEMATHQFTEKSTLPGIEMVSDC